MALPKPFLAHMRAAPYSPRSDKHSNALAEAIVLDLLNSCPSMSAEASTGDLVYDLNFDLVYATATWNVDLVLGRPPHGSLPPTGVPIRRTAPASVQIAVEIKGVMTEHRKNIKNRKRDLESHHQHVHNYNAQTIAAGVLVLNAASTFRSPLRPPGVITQHKNLPAMLQHCANEVQAVTVRAGSHGAGLDAKTLLVIDNDNQNLPATSYYTTPPAPKVGNPMHYDTFIQRICSEWTGRFGP